MLGRLAANTFRWAWSYLRSRAIAATNRSILAPGCAADHATELRARARNSCTSLVNEFHFRSPLCALVATLANAHSIQQDRTPGFAPPTLSSQHAAHLTDSPSAVTTASAYGS